jgi:hypothetical protein
LPESNAASTGSDREPRRWVLVWSVFAATAAYALLRGPGPRLHSDSIQDYLLARACRQGLGCWAHGTSVRDVMQGRLLLHLLGAMIDLSPWIHHAMFVAWLAAAVALLAHLAAQELGTRAALDTAMLGTLMLMAAAGYPTIWNPTLATLPLVVFVLALTRIAEGRAAWSLVAALAAALAYHGHMVHIALVPMLALVCALALSDWRWSLGAVALALLSIVSLDGGVPQQPAPLIGMIIVSSSVLALLGRRLAPRFTTRSTTQRRKLMVLGHTLAILLGTVMLSLVLGMPMNIRYWAAAVPGLVLVAAYAIGLLAERGRAWPRVVRFLLVVALAIPVVRTWGFAHYTMTDAHDLARYTAARGLDHRALLDRLQGPRRHDLLEAARIWSAPTPDRPTSGTARLRVLPWRGFDATPDGWQRLSLGLGRAALVSDDGSPWLELTSFESCWNEAEHDHETCVMVDDRVRWVSDPILTGDSHNTSIATSEQINRLSQRIAVTVAGTGPRTIVVEPMWTVAAVTGLAHTIGSDGRSVELVGPLGATGTLELETHDGLPMRVPGYPAVIIELDATELDLLPKILASDE